MDIDMLTDDEVIELQDRLVVRAESIEVTAELRIEIERRLAALPLAKTVEWNDAKRQLGL